MLPDEALKSMKVMFATPCYISAVSMHYVTSIFELTHHCNRFGLECILHMHSESLITRSRNKMVLKFLSDETLTHLFWIDSDITFTPQSVCRLLLIDRDVTAGVYPMKDFNWPAEGLPAGTTKPQFEDRYTQYPFNPIGHGNERVSSYADADGFVEVAEAPTGFMCIKRGVFDRLIAAYPEQQYVPDWPKGTYPEGGVHYRFFDVMVDPESRRYLSEDYGFCRLWEKIGGEVFVDATSNLSHQGERIFTGDFATTLQTALPSAVGAPEGQRMHIKGLENLKRKT